ncbi:hypothetical protein GO755_05600 [Spirosoma sp. HMF4905]|uniref:Ig-like domain-containing protein n=1 Tax=Spirosoma arboris TaxID=2682092 RepID=A0A7K1S7B9_9BACT|nr:hypothetical protein [Spirosoma arboris]MVM29498.1 hypothetical protein [Spirosoma arboris]
MRAKLQSGTVSKAGDYAGWVLSSGGTLNVDLFNAMTLKTYSSGTLQETKTGPSLISLDVLGLLGTTQNEVAFKSTKDFDEVELIITGSSILTLSLFNSVNYYFAFGSKAAATFNFNCGSATTTGIFVAGTPSSGTLTVPVTGSTSGVVSLSVTGSGFTSSPAPYTAAITNGQTTIPVLISYDGTGVSGTRSLSITSTLSFTSGPGSCSTAVTVYPAPSISFTNPAPNSLTSTTPLVSGTATAGISLTISGPSGQSCVTTADVSTGAWSCSSMILPAGPVTLTAVAGNPAGTATATRSFTAVSPPCTTPSALTLSTTAVSLTIGQAITISTLGGTPGILNWLVSPTTGIGPVTSGTGTTTGSLTFATAGTYSLTYTATNSTVPVACINPVSVTATATITVTDPLAVLNLRVLLGGAYSALTDLMRDDLRQNNLLPLAEPYSQTVLVGTGFTHVGGGGNESTTSAVFSTTGANAIVDWVFVELRNPASASTVVATHSALVQRDGDIVATDGTSPLSFSVGAGSYYISVRHRNHLGVMTATSRALSSTAIAIDFTNPATATYGSDAQQLISTTNKRVLWAGNADANRSIIYQGSNNDVSRVLSQVQLDPGNTNALLTYIATTYSTGDLDLNGQTICQGAGNDLQVIFLNELLHPNNTSFSIAYIVSEQIP